MIRLKWPLWRRVPHRGGREGHADANPPKGTGAPHTIRGERGGTVASGTRSLQSRLNGMLAAALAIGVGIAMLGWYYSEAARGLKRPTIAVRQTHPGAGRMTLPPLGPIELPRLKSLPAQPRTIASAASLAPPVESVSAMPGLAEPALPKCPQALGARSRVGPARGAALARRLSGAVFAHLGAGPAGASAGASPSPDAGAAPGVLDPDAAASRARRGRGSDALSALLRPTVLRATRAQLLPQQRLLLPQGAFIDCTLETAIDSSLPGMTTCVTATDTFSADGTVVLLPRGTKLIGQTRGQVRQGMARVFVIWVEARTPAGVVVRLDSPGTDALGRSGLTGEVDRHFWERFGSALLVSSIDAQVQSRLQSGRGTIVLDPMTSEDVLTEELRGTADIPPTVTVRNGARIEVLVARDVDFRSVYELVPRP